jgi:hypothetical protein
LKFRELLLCGWVHNYAEGAEANVVFGPQTVHYSDRDLVLRCLQFEGLFPMPSLIILTNRTCLTVFKRSPLGSRLVCLLICIKTFVSTVHPIRDHEGPEGSRGIAVLLV